MGGGVWGVRPLGLELSQRLGRQTAASKARGLRSILSRRARSPWGSRAAATWGLADGPGVIWRGTLSQLHAGHADLGAPKTPRLCPGLYGAVVRIKLDACTECGRMGPRTSASLLGSPLTRTPSTAPPVSMVRQEGLAH